MKPLANSVFRRVIALALVVAHALLPLGNMAHAAALAISDTPVTATSDVPPNMMLTLSVEWPTGTVAAYNDNASTLSGQECPGRETINVGGTNIDFGRCYFESRTYLGLFDPQVCYDYDTTNGYFYPVATGTGTYLHKCSTKWSGNYLNWATMHALDEFRFALTGGDRYIDTSTLTVLEKTLHSGQGGNNQFPPKRIRSDSTYGTGAATVSTVTSTTVTAKNWTNVYSRVTNNTTPLGSGSTLGIVFQVSSSSDFSTNLSTYNVRVKACDPSYLPSDESRATCTSYGTSLKPTGLIQQNADRMRFGITSYLNDSSVTRPGGVLRSQMKFVGPNNIVPNGTPTTNTAKEILSDGTQPVNPEGATEGNSGVINYLNRFGKTSQTYKGFDPLSEMYYESQRYMRGLTPTPEYTSAITTPMKDGFPVITTWPTLAQQLANVQSRPIQYACQNSFFVGIADSNTHCDVDVPGNSLVPSTGDNTHCGSGTSAHQTAYGGTDSQINITTLDNAVGTLENNSTKYGSNSLGTTFADYGLGTSNASTVYRRYNSFHAAGLAYWANTRDILPDTPTYPWTVGDQWAQTYWVDVRETGSSEPPPGNQLWLAAKYGGFDNRTTNTSNVEVFKSAPTATADWDSDGNGIPDNYFSGNQPAAVIDALSSIFQDIHDKARSVSSGSISTQNLTTAAGAFTVSFKTGEWTGDVTARALSVDSTSGMLTLSSDIWSAQTLLDTLAGGTGWNTTRKIASYNGTSGVPFRQNNASGGNLTSTQLGYLGSDAASQAKAINYLRGERTYEAQTFRKRKHLLGDIINSQATYVDSPSEKYVDAFNPGFSSFKSTLAALNGGKGPKPVIYVGANDGMLHAFDACAATTGPLAGACIALGGNELFAYVPSFVLSGPSSPATPTVNGLAARAKNGAFAHKYYVDQTPWVVNVDFARTGVAPVGGFSSSTTPDWHTLLVAGLNKGGRGYYALDVTRPDLLTSEASVASKVLWEFTDPDMGFTYGEPIVAKTAKYGWVVMVTSGYNNTLGSTAANRGKGYLYILNAKTGALLEKIGTGEGSETSPSGLSDIEAFIPDPTDFTTGEVYGGDLYGNLWRFDVSQIAGTTGSYPAPTKIAILKDATGAGANTQPITAAPRVEVDGVKRWVFVGTGKLFDATDLSTSGKQTFYAIRDGTVTAPYTSATLPSGVSFPIDPRATMVANTNLLTGITANASLPMGWFVDLSTSTTGGPSERVTTTAVANEGIIAWFGLTPAVDPCTPGASSTIYAVDYATGKSRLLDSSGNVTGSLAISQMVTGIFFYIRNGKIGAGAWTGDPTQPPETLTGNWNASSGIPVRLNWREILQ